jgi:hypothetical protein
MLAPVERRSHPLGAVVRRLRRSTDLMTSHPVECCARVAQSRRMCGPRSGQTPTGRPARPPRASPNPRQACPPCWKVTATVDSVAQLSRPMVGPSTPSRLQHRTPARRRGHPSPHRTAPHRTAPHRTAPHRTAPHRTAPRCSTHPSPLGSFPRLRLRVGLPCGLRPDIGRGPESIPGWWLGPGRIRPQGWAEGGGRSRAPPIPQRHRHGQRHGTTRSVCGPAPSSTSTNGARAVAVQHLAGVPAGQAHQDVVIEP